ncbi:MAG TPA: hypothetical protein VGK93_11165 [Candidatus Eisenbacteria bacterium]|jgi:hypothetical protein
MGTNMSVIPGLDPGLVSHASALAVLATGFLVACSALVAGVAMVKHRRLLAAAAAGVGASVAGAYGLTLLGLSIASREQTLVRGEEKYFCEPDCHLAYSVADVRVLPLATRARPAMSGGRRLEVTIRVRFDERTTAPWRHKDATLAPERRSFDLVDGTGRSFPPVRIASERGFDVGGAALLKPLRPGESFRAILSFEVPQGARDLRLLIRDQAWDYQLIVAHENSLLHKKTLLGL